MRIIITALALILLATALPGTAMAGDGLRTATQLDLRTRHYPNENPKHVTQMAANIFELAQADYRIVSGKQGVIAYREWGWETIFDGSLDLDLGGSAYWYVDMTQDERGVVVQVRCVFEPDPHTSLSPDDHQDTPGKLVSAQTMEQASPQAQEDQKAAALYTIFFNRLDVLLGQNRYWLYCRAAEEYVKMEKLTGTLDAWCYEAGDARPGTLSQP